MSNRFGEENNKEMLGNVYVSNDEGDPVTLTPDDIKINGTIHGSFLDLFVRQVYTNQTDKAQTFRYIFSNDNSCMYGTIFYIGDEKIQLVIQEKQVAESTYSEAKESGYAAVIGRTLREGLKEFEIGNVPPHISCSLEVHFGILLQVHDDSISFGFPLTLSSLSYSAIDISSTSCPFSLQISTNRSDIVSVNTNDLEFQTTKDPETNNLTISSNKIKNSNCKIELKCSKPISSEAYFSSSYGSVLVIPPSEFSTHQNNSDFVFIIDCSGSMSGSRIKSARECLGIFVKSLPKDCCFEIIRFGSNAVNLFNKLEPLTPESMKKAIILSENLQADLGGTEVLNALQKALELPSRPGHPVQIFLITDGEDWNRDASIKFAESKRSKTRIFALGISNEADRGLVNSLAEVTGGSSDIILGNDTSEKTIRLLKTARTAAISDLSLQLESEVPEIVPFPTPILYYGSSQTLFFKTEQSNISNILVSGKSGSDDVDIPVNSVDLDENAQNCMRALFAQQAIKDYQREMENKDSIEKEKMKQKIIELSISSGILSEYTAFVGVSNTVIPNDISYQRSTPIHYALYNNSKDIGELLISKGADINARTTFKCFAAAPPAVDFEEFCCFAAAPPPPPPPPCCAAAPPPPAACFDKAADLDDLCCLEEASAPNYDDLLDLVSSNVNSEVATQENSNEMKKPPQKPEIPKEVPNYDFKKIIMNQDFNGYWNNPKDILIICGINSDFLNQKEVKDILKQFEDVSKGDKALEEKITATLLALSTLLKKSSDRKDAWSIVEENALLWLNTCSPSKDWTAIINLLSQLI